MIKLSVNKTKWSSLLARTRALILYISIWIFDFGPVKLPGLSRNGPQVWKRVWKMTTTTTTTTSFICMIIPAHTVLQKQCLGIKIITQGNYVTLIIICHEHQMNIFWSETEGHYLENRATHPHQEFPGVPPWGRSQRIYVFCRSPPKATSQFL